MTNNSDQKCDDDDWKKDKCSDVWIYQQVRHGYKLTPGDLNYPMVVIVDT